MKAVCAWCETILSPPTEQSDEITHGICQACVDEIFAEATPRMSDTLDEIPPPILLVGEEGRVIAANRAALRMTGKDLDTIGNRLGGEVMECVHSYEAGGCGQTLHCNGCTIRNTVMDTFETGVNHLDVPAYLDIQSPDGVTRQWFNISTQLVAGKILLQVVKKS